MLAYILALAVGFGSFGLYMAAFFFPEVHRKYDFTWSGVGLFYALVLWVCAGRITGGVLLGQLASVALLGWFAWQTLSLRRELTPPDRQTRLPGSAVSLGEVLQNKLGQLQFSLNKKAKASGLEGVTKQVESQLSSVKGFAEGMRDTTLKPKKARPTIVIDRPSPDASQKSEAPPAESIAPETLTETDVVKEPTPVTERSAPTILPTETNAVVPPAALNEDGFNSETDTSQPPVLKDKRSNSFSQAPRQNDFVERVGGVAQSVKGQILGIFKGRAARTQSVKKSEPRVEAIANLDDFDDFDDFDELDEVAAVDGVDSQADEPLEDKAIEDSTIASVEVVSVEVASVEIIEVTEVAVTVDADIDADANSQPTDELPSEVIQADESAGDESAEIQASPDAIATEITEPVESAEPIEEAIAQPPREEKDAEPPVRSEAAPSQEEVQAEDENPKTEGDGAIAPIDS